MRPRGVSDTAIPTRANAFTIHVAAQRDAKGAWAWGVELHVPTGPSFERYGEPAAKCLVRTRGFPSPAPLHGPAAGAASVWHMGDVRGSVFSPLRLLVRPRQHRPCPSLHSRVRRAGLPRMTHAKPYEVTYRHGRWPEHFGRLPKGHLQGAHHSASDPRAEVRGPAI